jgi:hypothetical protein
MIYWKINYLKEQLLSPFDENIIKYSPFNY